MGRNGLKMSEGFKRVERVKGSKQSQGLKGMFQSYVINRDGAKLQHYIIVNRHIVTCVDKASFMASPWF